MQIFSNPANHHSLTQNDSKLSLIIHIESNEYYKTLKILAEFFAEKLQDLQHNKTCEKRHLLISFNVFIIRYM